MWLLTGNKVYVCVCHINPIKCVGRDYISLFRCSKTVPVKVWFLSHICYCCHWRPRKFCFVEDIRIWCIRLDVRVASRRELWRQRRPQRKARLGREWVRLQSGFVDRSIGGECRGQPRPPRHGWGIPSRWDGTVAGSPTTTVYGQRWFRSWWHTARWSVWAPEPTLDETLETLSLTRKDHRVVRVAKAEWRRYSRDSRKKRPTIIDTWCSGRWEIKKWVNAHDKLLTSFLPFWEWYFACFVDKSRK